MRYSRLTNYLKMHRKILGFNTNTVATLLGGCDRTHVARHERFVREPTLVDAFKYEAIYSVSVDDLFAGIRQDAFKQVAEQAGTELRRLENSTDLKPRKRLTSALRSIEGLAEEQ